MIEIQVDDKVLADIGRGFAIPARPELLLELQNIMQQSEPKLDDVAALIAKDVATSATILKTINSPLYGLARSISDIKKSVRYIGLNGVYSLVTTCLIKQGYDQKDCAIELESFWNNANNIANAAVFIGSQIKHRISAEKLFTIGLFHDCGIPAMAMKYDNYKTTFEFAQQNPSKTLPQIEEHVYQVNHAILGYYVASSWRLPKDICQLILRHHDRELLHTLDQSEFQLAFAILKTAENLVSEYKDFRATADWTYLKDSVFTVLEIDDEDYADWHEDLQEQWL